MIAFKHLPQQHEEAPKPRLVHQRTPKELCFLPIGKKGKGKGIELKVGDRVSGQKHEWGRVKTFVPDLDPDVGWLNPWVMVDWDNEGSNPVSPLYLTRQPNINTGSIVWLPAKAQEAKILQIKNGKIVSNVGLISPEDIKPLEAITCPAYRQMGSKFKQADWINQTIKDYAGSSIAYVEPFGGSWSVGLKRYVSDIEVYNDIDPEAVNFWQQLQRNPQELIELIESSLFTKEEYEACSAPADDPIEAARRFYLRSQLDRIGAGSRWKSGYSAANASMSHDHLWSISCRINKLQIYNLDALDIINKYDNPATIFYIDWPYPWETRSKKDNCSSNARTPRRQYKYELPPHRYEEIAKRLMACKARVFVSTPPGLEHLFPDWHKLKTSVYSPNHRSVTEYLWISSNCQLAQEYEQADFLHTQIATLERELEQINQLGIGPDAWIEQSKCHKRKGTQVYWRSSQAIFGGAKRKYIGMLGSDKHREAEQLYHRRCRLKQITSELKILRNSL